MDDDITIDLVPELDEQVLQMVEVKDSAYQAAEKVADIAIATAPVVSGDYRDGIEVQVTKSGARVFASDPKSAFVEFGVPSQGEPAQFNLRRAAEAAGLKFTKRKH